MTASTTRSRRTKGNQFQKEIAKKIQSCFGLEERDVVSTPSAVPGVDILLSNRAKEVFNYAIEAKRQESLSIWKCLEQAEKNSNGSTPLLVFKRNRSDIYCCLKFDDFMNILQRGYSE